MDQELFNRLMHGLFAFSPVAICISTTGKGESRYVRVNDAYLTLVGLSWETISSQLMTGGGAVVDDERRSRRQHLLETVGHYAHEEVEIRRSDGKLLSTLISAQRYRTGGVSYDIEIIVDVTARKAAERALWRAAHVDALTGVFNRGHFLDSMQATIEASRVSGRGLALALIDIDFFKLVNDRYGHMAGDRVLTTIAAEIARVAGERGLVGRLGGDEFAVLFTDASDREHVLRQIEAIGLALETAEPVSDGALPCTVTIGYAFMPDDAIDADALMRAADLALYRGKQGGRAVAIPFAELQLSL